MLQKRYKVFISLVVQHQSDQNQLILLLMSIKIKCVDLNRCLLRSNVFLFEKKKLNAEN